MNEILRRIYAAVLRRGDAPAYVVRDTRISYKQLWRQALELAQHLRGQGCGPVVLYGHKGAEMPVGIVACLLANRAYVPVDTVTPTARLRQIVAATGAELLLSREEIRLTEAECATPEQLISRPLAAPCDTSANQTAYIIFTSGSSGTPKGVPVSYDSLSHFIAWLLRRRPLAEYRDIGVFNQASFQFDLSVADFYYALCCGHTLTALTRTEAQDCGAIFSALRRSSAAVAVMTPTFAQLCLLDGGFCAQTLPQLSCLFLCGEVLPAAVAKRLLTRFPHLIIYNAYGPTEATCAVSAVQITPALCSGGALPVGREGDFAVQITVEDGEIVLQGRSVAHGYCHGMTGGFFMRGGAVCYRTGDSGRLQDGFLYCTGRRDSQVKYKGYRIEPADIEQNLLQIRGVSACAVVPRYAPDGSVKLLKAYAAAPALTEQQIKAELAQRLPAYMIPKTVHLTDTLPMTANGKIDRKLLEEL